MSYTARKLIINAYYLSSLVSKKLETVTGDQIDDGLGLLNDLIADKAADNQLIPFYGSYEFDAKIGQEKYFIPNLVADETTTFNIGDVRMPTENVSRRRYFGSARVDGVKSLPSTRHFERVKGGSDLYLYFVPDAEYPIKIRGKFALDEIEDLEEDLSETYERGYINYMKYELGSLICDENNITFPIEAANQLVSYRKRLKNISPRDWSVSKVSTLGRRTGMNWAYVNFPGWSP